MTKYDVPFPTTFMYNFNVNTPVAGVVNPVRRIKISHNEWEWLVRVRDALRESPAGEEDKATTFIGLCVTQVDWGGSILL